MMSEYRTDPTAGHTVLIAEGRSQRPQEFAPRRASLDGESCPFCPGRESETPGEVYAVRSDRSRPDSPGWQIRAVPNKYPALEVGADANSETGVARPESSKGVDAATTRACGLHEVLIESPLHIALTSELSADELAAVFRATISRIRAMYADPRIKHVLPFKNVGPSSGASLSHLHSQIIGQPLVPPEFQRELDHGARHVAKRNRCLWCELIDRERDDSAGVVVETPRFVVLCPHASRFPFETWLLPAVHAARFDDLDESSLVEFADLAHRLIGPLESLLDEPTYNYVIRSAPPDLPNPLFYHWQLQILPRATGIAGFELGAGIYINPLSPESAAARLRQSLGERQ